LSDIEERMYSLLQETFPHYKIERQFYIIINNQKLFFDFKVEVLKLLIEIQGEQHYNFNKFYHNDTRSFNQYKMRDKMKVHWAEENSYTLLSFSQEEIPKDKFELINLIHTSKVIDG